MRYNITILYGGVLLLLLLCLSASLCRAKSSQTYDCRLDVTAQEDLAPFCRMTINGNSAHSDAIDLTLKCNNTVRQAPTCSSIVAKTPVCSEVLIFHETPKTVVVLEQAAIGCPSNGSVEHTINFLGGLIDYPQERLFITHKSATRYKVGIVSTNLKLDSIKSLLQRNFANTTNIGLKNDTSISVIGKDFYNAFPYLEQIGLYDFANYIELRSVEIGKQVKRVQIDQVAFARLSASSINIVKYNCRTVPLYIQIARCNLSYRSVSDEFIHLADSDDACAPEPIQQNFTFKLLKNNFGGQLRLSVFDVFLKFAFAIFTGFDMHFDPIRCCDDTNAWLFNMTLKERTHMHVYCEDLGTKIADVFDYAEYTELKKTTCNTTSIQRNLVWIVLGAGLLIAVSTALLLLMCYHKQALQPGRSAIRATKTLRSSLRRKSSTPSETAFKGPQVIEVQTPRSPIRSLRSQKGSMRSSLSKS